MAKFSASTKADQIKAFKRSIPEGCDTRRAKTQIKDLKLASRSFGGRKVLAKDNMHLLKGMKTPLRSHQLTAASWMVERENAIAEPFGGILADVMGMGKTVTSLALIVGHPPEAEDVEEYCRATLVIVPSRTVAKQWRDEVSNHTSEATDNFTTIFTRGSGARPAQLGLQHIV
jgi:SNF2 family DNA or RNA helicase